MERGVNEHPIASVSDEEQLGATTSSSSEAIASSEDAASSSPKGGVVEGGTGGGDNDSGYNSDFSPDGTSDQGEDSDESDFLNVYSNHHHHGNGAGAVGGGAAADDDCSDESSVGSKIRYIKEKQELLERYCDVLGEEERYDAATARTEVAWLCSTEEGEDGAESVWSEAKEVLRVICQKAGELRINQTTPRTSLRAVASRKRGPPNPMDPKISLSSVDKLSSAKYEKGRRARSDSPGEELALGVIPEDVFNEGQWMAKALIWSEPVSAKTTVDADVNPQDCRWRVVSDPVTCSLGLLPPNSMSLPNAVDLQEAIAVTNQARLVTQSTPPFCVVHVNRAFLLLAGLGAREHIIGKPVESMIQITQPIPKTENDAASAAPTSADDDDDDGENDQRCLDSIISLHQNHTACRIRVVPVVDRSRRRRISRNRRSSRMSHVLIQVLPSTTTQPDTESRPIMKKKRKISHFKSPASPTSDTVVGTIG